MLLIDEVLAVGDAAFQQKCFEQFEQLKRDGRTIVLVTHDMSAVERFCDRAMLIDRGAHARRSASPHEIALRLQRAQLRPPRPRARPRTAATATTPTAEIKDAWFEDDAGERITELAQGAAVHDVHGGARSTRRSTSPIFAFHLRNEPRHTVFATSSDWRGEPDRAASPPARRVARARALRQLARAEALHGQPVGRARRRAAPTRSTCARTSRRSSCTATRVHRRDRRRAAHVRAWSARERRRRSASSPLRARRATRAASGT